jgi:hypothetical protein
MGLRHRLDLAHPSDGRRHSDEPDQARFPNDRESHHDPRNDAIGESFPDLNGTGSLGDVAAAWSVSDRTDEPLTRQAWRFG